MTSVAASSAVPRGLSRLFGLQRIRVTLIAAGLLGLLLSLPSETATYVVVLRALIVGFAAMLMFGVFEQWPRTLRRVPRSVLQLIAIVVVIPLAAMLAYTLTTHDYEQFTDDQKRAMAAGFGMLVFTGILFAPWIAVGAMLKQRDTFAREQALAFELERSQLERSALDARLRLLQAQVEPHFLFNTLANVQALVDAGSPQASRVLASLIAYLRAAVPRMHESSTRLDQELRLVRAYLDVMQMRMPDRLQFSLRVDPAAQALPCPPMTVLTLVENAVRHGIDPSEDGGRIDIDVMVRGERCIIRVSDTGVGLQASSDGLGTGLSTLRERLRLAYGGSAQLRLLEVEPRGVCAELDLPMPS
ncbi:MAG TPA: histidine kinase [Povalibacter sp.]|uniref:sensor histidine kinase n=1 Tax=Povalibacter sp. TaxID=1962978 RepID=UPI002BF9D130|nr:histidine kinase [Povalibacter sp.]HMN44046.1 histidine kinase [Povalibacter sp.]